MLWSMILICRGGGCKEVKAVCRPLRGSEGYCGWSFGLWRSQKVERVLDLDIQKYTYRCRCFVQQAPSSSFLLIHAVILMLFVSLQLLLHGTGYNVLT